jgi:hypothetical protein
MRAGATGGQPYGAPSYWEDARALAAALASGQAPPAVTVPLGFTTFPGEIWASPRSWVEIVYPDLAYFNEADRGGHFAAWEEPEPFAAELRAAFSSLANDTIVCGSDEGDASGAPSGDECLRHEISLVSTGRAAG